jgi:hypothetical protein
LLCLDDRSFITRAPRDVTFDESVFPLRNKIDQQNLDAIRSSDNAQMDEDIDYFDFNVPSLTVSGGVDQEPRFNPSLAAPYVAPTTPPNVMSSPTFSTPPLTLPPLLSSNGTPNVHQDHVIPMPLWQQIQNDPHTPSRFLQSIPPDLPRLRSSSASSKLAEEVYATEDHTHVALEHYVLLSEQNRIDIVTPKSYAQAMSLPEKEKWKLAMDKEMEAIVAAKTYVLVPGDTKPPHIKVESPVWSFKVKFDGTFKARLCFPGHRQQFGVDYFQTESPVARFTSFRAFCIIATQLQQEIHISISQMHS